MKCCHYPRLCNASMFFSPTVSLCNSDDVKDPVSKAVGDHLRGDIGLITDVV